MNTNDLGLRDLLPGHYMPNEAQLEEAWRDGIFVLDANALLDLYKLPNITREEIQNAYQSVGSRIWCPFQIALEFESGRERVLAAEWEKARKITEKPTEAKNLIFSAIDELHLKPREIHQDPQALKDSFASACKEIMDIFKAAKETFINPKDVDSVRLFVAALLQGRISDPPSSQLEVDALETEGEKRYALRIPPGYADKKSDSTLAGGLTYQKKYGDHVLWQQVLSHFSALKIKRDLVFVTGESKEDWIKKDVAGISMPHPELVSEFKRKCGGRTFLIYSVKEFLQASKNRLATVVSDAALQEVTNIEAEDALADDDSNGMETRSFDVSSWIRQNVHAGLESSGEGQGGQTLFLPKHEKSAGAFVVIKPVYDAPGGLQRFGIRLKSISDALSRQGWSKTTFIFHCYTEEGALDLPNRLDIETNSDRMFFIWRAEDEIFGLERLK